ncbi:MULTISPECIES: NAD(P)/FAD-dependent oxidoreductase [unclassified Oleiphilus]|jgi:2-polyprenyl-6-methoxyphenol hydroxylase-like FAD-dependent oxidoreductase|uniref:FAD-dependent oxidoreductase n=2 Tax=Oleiphilus TaxID=141450 RepID=UPI0007C2A760|nr:MULTISPECIES: FAD-dependent monooxygenase [unclassified Oleiphilus]KZY41010.1 hypothetical protein A3732_03260 [Oleiphilus sp. HI0050]KZZ34579.1 hypothetical protein A3756_03175 [Oleiphilus sp. HI0086]KZZ38207.1 hypothetical protein A3757_08315 [Oleiphilus sp. HI0117]KZZ57849.1 hypothetical protein A3761_06425 [Oleiphilus sp. HI0123]
MASQGANKGTALVIGGSISGMLSAKVLSEHFDLVVILEKDAAPDELSSTSGELFRKGLPQAAHQHLLLLKGRQLFEEFFPGFDAELERYGAPLVNYSEDVSLFIGEGKLPRFESGLDLRVCRRPLIDRVVTERIESIENIERRYACQVSGFILNNDNSRVTGLRYQQGSISAEKTLRADLVVDCSGRGSRTRTWLKKEGLSEVSGTHVNPKLGYASQLFEVRPGQQVKPIEVAPHAPTSPRAAGLWPVENNKWLLTLIGMNAVYPGNDLNGFTQFAAELPTKYIHRALSDMSPASGITHFRGTENVWHRYDQMKDHPSGLLVMGDAMCAFNPLYGQGLTLIAMAAKSLALRLEQGARSGFSNTWARRTYRRFNRFFFTAWMIAISEDMRWPETEGRNIPWYLNVSYRYMDRLLAACIHSKPLAHCCLSIANMVSSPLSLLRPDVMLKAFWFGRKKQVTLREECS